MRTILSKLGIYTSKATEIGLREIYPEDVFIVSFPKSGNTWVRFLIANMLSEGETVTLKNINNYVPGIYNFRKEIDKKEPPRFIKSHGTEFASFPKTVYIYRDYRDVVISYFYYLKGHGQFDGSLQEFVRSKQLRTPFGTWEEHLSEALKYRAKFPDQILFVGFDQLKNDTVHTVEKIAMFCGITPTISVEKVVQKCDFEALQAVEQKHGKVFETSKVDFFRSGELAQWKTELTEEDLVVLMTDHVKNVFNQLNLEL